MNSFLSSFLRRNSYLILAAAGLLTVGYLLNSYLGSVTSTRFLTRSIQSFLQSREKDFLRLTKDSALTEDLLLEDYNKSRLEALLDKQYGILLYEQEPGGLTYLRFWSDQRSVPPDSLLSRPDGHYFVSLNNGQYEFIKISLPKRRQSQRIYVGLIPIHWQYYISTDALRPGFVDFPNAENRVQITSSVTEFPVSSSFGKVLFYLQRTENYNAAKYSWLLIILVFIGVLLLLVVLHNLARAISERAGPGLGTLFLVSAIVVLRSILYLSPYLLHLREYELFNPVIYSSSFLLSSLGDLLINALLFSWIILFIRQESGGYMIPLIRNRWKRWLLNTLVLTVLVVTTFLFANIVQSLVADSKEISFNVLDFFSLTIYSIVGFIVLAALTLSYFFFTQMLLRLVRHQIRRGGFVVFIITPFVGLLLLTFLRNVAIVELDLFVLVWLLLYLWLMLRNLFSGLSLRLNVSEVLFWLFMFSMSIATVIIFENHKIEYQQRTRFADRLAEQEDPTSEKLLTISLIYFDNEFLSPNFFRFRDSVDNQGLKDSLINSNNVAYRDKFETHIYTFDSSQHPLYNENPVSFDTLNTIFEVQGRDAAGIQDLRYVEKAFDKFSYIFRKKVEDRAHRTLGYLFILADPKNYKGSGLVPQLTQQRGEYLPGYSSIDSYAIYSDEDLVYHYNSYPFPTVMPHLHLAINDFIQRKNEAFNATYEELWHRISFDKVIVIARRNNSVIEAITLFAYIFSAFLFLGALVWLTSILIQTRLHWSQLRTYFQLNIRSQIHTTIIFVSVFSFIVIGVATIISLINRYKRNTLDNLSHSMRIIANEVQARLPDLSDISDTVRLSDIISATSLEQMINNIAEIHGADINLYDLNGQLIVSSNRFVYTKGILSEKMHALAYYNMHLLHAVEYFNSEEQMGRIANQSIYCPLRLGSGAAAAYLNIPSFRSQADLNEEISKFLVTIINLNVFIFLIAGSIALFLTNRITSSLILISEKMRRINLGKTNEPIEWKNQDEIGGLVKEYNKMVNKLEESAAALVKSEREGAWREMARQVAHEIKNPLTPMKLSIQYLQKAIDNNSDNIKELTASVAKTLVEQIDHLSKIAADFSQFANIGNPKNEVFDLHDMLYSLTSLYETTDNLLFKWVPVHQRIMVYADKTQLNRLFTNLLQNALEACHDQEKRVISVSEELTDHSILVKVADNGEGIPESMHSKIFMPNFTTKSSGTGLGLAMSKTIIEQAKGKIWFDTRVGGGTTFYIELPILRAVN